MGFAIPPAAFLVAPAAGRRRDACLPADIAFLRRYHVDEAALRAAAAGSRRCGADASAVLVAEGGASDTLYYGSLARHLGLAFRLDWPQVDVEAVGSLRRDRVRLAGGGWLLAPTGAMLHLLLAARRRGLPLAETWSITTPAHLAALLVRRLQAPIAAHAGAGLAEAAPPLSARGALGGAGGGALAATAMLGFAGLLAGSRLAVDVLCAVFFAALCFRMMVSAAGWPSPEPPPAHPPPDDTELPGYSVLVPLRDEAAMVPALVAALAALSYPDLGSKLTKQSLGQRFTLALWWGHVRPPDRHHPSHEDRRDRAHDHEL